MPPKRKGKKKTKAQEEAERLAREEEERKQAEIEAKRAEEERIRREELDRQARIEAAKQRAEELERLAAEGEAARATMTTRAERLRLVVVEEEAAKEWGKYVACETRHDAARERELNTFVDTWRATQTEHLGEALESCAYAATIVEDLLEVQMAARARGDMDKWASCQEFLGVLRDLTVGKIDFASAQLLQHSEDYTRPEARNEVLVTAAGGGISFGVWVNLIPRGFRMKQLGFNDVGIIVDIPKPLALQSIAVRVLFFPYDHASHGADNVGDMALGGTFNIELLALPPPPKKVRGWTLRPVTALSTTVQRLSYPLGSHEGAAVPTPGAAQALRIQYAVPDHVMVPEEPRVGWWDQQRKRWSEEGVSEVTFNQDERTVHFHTVRLTTLALIQSKHHDMAYKSWSLRPVAQGDEFGEAAPECAHLSLLGGRYNVVIEIGETQCRLVEPDLPELQELREEWLDPGVLLMRLAESGINLMPEDDDASEVVLDGCDEHVTPRHAAVEAKAEFDVSSIVASFDIAGSRWNKTLPPDQTVFRLRETSVFTDVDDDRVEFKTVLMRGDEDIAEGVKSCVVACTEDSLEFTDQPLESHATHVHLSSCLTNFCTPESLERIETSSLRFQLTVRRLLHLVRPFSFA